MKHEEYLRRNLVHAGSVGVVAGLEVAIKRLGGMKSAPKWLKELLASEHKKAAQFPAELAAWRNAAPDAPNSTPSPGL